MAGKYALLIGNGAFRHQSLARLSAPPNDVLEFKQILEDPEIAGFDSVELKMDAALVDIRGSIGRLYRDRHPDDLVLFYYSGHGLRDQQGDFYLALTESDPDAPDAGSLDEFFLRRQMNGSASRRQLMILDCCHSGAFIPEGLTARDAGRASQITADTFEPSGYGRFILAATTADLSAFEEDGRSLYTRYLVEGLKTGAAAPEKDEISVHDLHAFVSRRVVEDTGAPMKPQLWVDARSNPEPLLLARNPHPKQTLDPRFVKAIWDPDTIVAEWGVLRLMEVMRDAPTSLAAEARAALSERLGSSDTLNYAVGIRIEEVLAEDRKTTLEAAAATPDRSPKTAESSPKPAPARESKPPGKAKDVKPAAETPPRSQPPRSQPPRSADADSSERSGAAEDKGTASTRPATHEKVAGRTALFSSLAGTARGSGKASLEIRILTALGIHVLFGCGLFYADPTAKRRWLYVFFPVYALADLVLGPGLDIDPFRGDFGAQTFFYSLFVFGLSFIDVAITSYLRFRQR